MALGHGSRSILEGLGLKMEAQRWKKGLKMQKYTKMYKFLKKIALPVPMLRQVTCSEAKDTGSEPTVCY